MQKIAIIGSTGMLGQPVTRAFLKAGFEVNILARDIKKARDLFGPGVHIVQGDVNAVSDIERFLQGQENLYLNLSVKQNSGEKDFQPERDGLKNILAAAQKTQVKHIGYLSSLIHLYEGFNWWVFDLKKAAVQQIKESGISYSIFYPSTFMESFDKGGYRVGRAINLAGKSQHPMYLIAGDDYARQVVRAFDRNKGNNEYVIQGPEAMTADEGAKVFLAHYTKEKLKIRKAPFFVLKMLAPFSKTMNYGRHIVEALNKYPEKFQAQKTWDELGQPQITLKEYAERG